jgi:hypothetical protein
MPDIETIIAKLDDWAAKSFRDSPITRDTAAWNHFDRSFSALKAELRALAPSSPQGPRPGGRGAVASDGALTSAAE